eukprot:14062777-Alexandrium_andersonii.AAC.1
MPAGQARRRGFGGRLALPLALADEPTREWRCLDLPLPVLHGSAHSEGVGKLTSPFADVGWCACNRHVLTHAP